MVKAKKVKEEKPEFTTQAQRFANYVANMPDAQRLMDVFNEFKESEKQAKLLVADVIPFGKHKGHTVDDVNTYDSNYLVWLGKQSFMTAYPLLLEQVKNAIN